MEHEAPVAALVADAVADPPTCDGVFRVLVFRSADAILTLEVRGDAAAPRLAGAVVPPPAAGAEVGLRGSESRTVAVDADGRFDIGPVAPGPLSIHVTLSGGGVQLVT